MYPQVFVRGCRDDDGKGTYTVGRQMIQHPARSRPSRPPRRRQRPVPGNPGPGMSQNRHSGRWAPFWAACRLGAGESPFTPFAQDAGNTCRSPVGPWQRALTMNEGRLRAFPHAPFPCQRPSARRGFAAVATPPPPPPVEACMLRGGGRPRGKSHVNRKTQPTVRRRPLSAPASSILATLVSTKVVQRPYAAIKTAHQARA